MKKVLLALVLLTVSACGKAVILGNTTGDQTPDSVQAVQGCYYGYGSQTCHVSFDDGQAGYTVENGGQSYICKGRGL